MTPASPSIGASAAQGIAQPAQPLALGKAIAHVVDRAQHHHGSAAVLRVARQRPSLELALDVPLVEALQRVDREDAHAAGFRLVANLCGLGTVEDRRAGQIVADLDRVELERVRQRHQLGEALARRHHVVDGVAQQMAQRSCSLPQAAAWPARLSPCQMIGANAAAVISCFCTPFASGLPQQSLEPGRRVGERRRIRGEPALDHELAEGGRQVLHRRHPVCEARARRVL